VSNLGVYDMILGRMHNFLMDHGTGKEDGNVMCNVILLTIMHLCRGEKVLVIVADCCGTGNCALLDWFCTFVVDELGWFTAAGVVYFWTNHGKGPADGRFGAHRNVYNQRTSLSVDMYGAHLEDVVNRRTSATDTTTILHTSGLSNFKAYAIKRTGGRVPYPTQFGVRQGNRHEVFAARNVGGLPAELSEYLKPFEAPPGWVYMRTHALITDPVKGFCFLPPVPLAAHDGLPPTPRMVTKNTAAEFTAKELKGEYRAPNRNQVLKIGHDFYKLRKSMTDMVYFTRRALFPPNYTGYDAKNPATHDLRVQPSSIFESRPRNNRGERQRAVHVFLIVVV
jgi:hypothetical protein